MDAPLGLSGNTNTSSNLNIQSNTQEHQPQPLSTRNSNLMNITSSNNKSLGQLSAAYSHFHNVMGSMPIYDIGDYNQHL